MAARNCAASRQIVTAPAFFQPVQQCDLTRAPRQWPHSKGMRGGRVQVVAAATHGLPSASSDLAGAGHVNRIRTHRANPPVLASLAGRYGRDHGPGRRPQRKIRPPYSSEQVIWPSKIGVRRATHRKTTPRKTESSRTPMLEDGADDAVQERSAPPPASSGSAMP